MRHISGQFLEDPTSYTRDSDSKHLRGQVPVPKDSQTPNANDKSVSSKISVKRRKLNEAETETLRRLISGFELSLSSAVDSTLTIAAEETVAAMDSQFVPWLDCQTMFFAFLSLGFEEQDVPHARFSLPLNLVQSLGFSEASLIDAKLNHGLRIKANTKPLGEPQSSALKWDDSFYQLWAAAERIKHQCSPRIPYIAARHLLAAFIQIAVERKDLELEAVGLALPTAIDAMVRNCSLYEQEDSPKGWAAFFAQYASARFKNGQTQDFNREGEERHAALRVDDYASTFAQFFRSAGSEECCLAVFAPWGRGKSYLMKRVKTKLQPHSYATVNFQAWRYPTRPEVWVHLYETMCHTAFDCPWQQKWPRVFRIGIARHGFGHLIWALLILTFALYPKLHLAVQTFGWLQGLVKLLGIGSAIWIGTFFFNAVKSAKKLSKEYLVTPNHSEKLGLQATIGDDLAALLEGWMPSNRWPGILPVIGFVASVWLLFQGAAHWGSFAPLGWQAGSWGVGAILPWFISCAMVICGAWLLSWFGEPKRILLVVDDLDRCSLEHLISVMESVKLLIEDKKVSRRLQVAMLVEEEVLKQAILNKYAPVRVSNGGSMSDDRIFRESCEKLFTVHLRLDPLTADEAEEVLSRMFGSSKPDSNYEYEERSPQHELDEIDAKSERKAGKETSPKSTSSDTRQNGRPNESAAPDRQGQKPPLTGDPPTSNRKPEKQDSAAQQSLPHFSLIEKGFLIAAVRDLVEARGNDVVGPRSVRNFVFRYQLARILLNQLRVPFEPGAVVQALASTMTNGRVDYPLNEQILRVVKQIS